MRRTTASARSTCRREVSSRDSHRRITARALATEFEIVRARAEEGEVESLMAITVSEPSHTGEDCGIRKNP